MLALASPLLSRLFVRVFVSSIIGVVEPRGRAGIGDSDKATRNLCVTKVGYCKTLCPRYCKTLCPRSPFRPPCGRLTVAASHPHLKTARSINRADTARQVITADNATFYRDLNLLGTAPMPRLLTDCYNHQARAVLRSFLKPRSVGNRSKPTTIG